MGADLYINSIYEPQQKKIEPLFNQAVAPRLDRNGNLARQATPRGCYESFKAESSG